MNALQKFLAASKWWLPLLMLAGLIWLLFFSKADIQDQQQIVSEHLQPGEKEKIIVQPQGHVLTVVTEKGVERFSLPNHPYSITLTDDNQLKINVRKKGLELSPFIGVGYDNSNIRGVIGSHLFFYHRLDIGLGLSVSFRNSGKDIRGMIVGSYNVWSNTSLYMGYDTRKHVNAGILVRF